MIEYLSSDFIISVNAAQDGDVGVRDLGGIEASSARPRSGFGGHEVFPDVWTKAAAYAHGFAATQHFFDGNKRTAWLATMIFLDANGYDLPTIPDIEAEAFINAVALDAWKADGDDASVHKAAEWLRTKWESASPKRSRRGWAVLAGSIEQVPGADACFDVGQLGLAVLAIPHAPNQVELQLLARVFWGPEDLGRTHVIDVAVEHQKHEFASVEAKHFPADIAPPAAVNHPHHDHGIMPSYISGAILLNLLDEGTLRLAVMIDGALLTKVPLSIRVIPSIGSGMGPEVWDGPPDWMPSL